jgi:dihydroorotate dehydrogenase (fumarate)
MDLSVRYLGLQLAHPFVMGASPWVDDMDRVRQIEDGGAAAIVMHSLFEEQLSGEALFRQHAIEPHEDSFGEALSYLPQSIDFALGPDEYLERIAAIKEAVSIPVVASLNGVSRAGWLEYGSLMEQAGADALELNVYALATDPECDAASLEAETLDMVESLRSGIRIPLAVKLSPFYSALAHFAGRLEAAGARGLVVFNRFYQPDLDIEQLEVRPDLVLSDSSELRLRLRWLAILSAQVGCDLAVTGGVHTLEDAVKTIMTGATTVQLVSEVLAHGAGRFRDLSTGLSSWLEEREYESLAQLRGSMNLARCPDPKAYERTNYVRTLQSWRG